jgi:hypothetical protein
MGVRRRLTGAQRGAALLLSKAASAGWEFDVALLTRPDACEQGGRRERANELQEKAGLPTKSVSPLPFAEAEKRRIRACVFLRRKRPDLPYCQCSENRGHEVLRADPGLSS